MTMASGGCCNDGGDSICVFGTTVRLIIVPFAFTCMVLVLSTCFILHLPLFDLTVLFNRYSHVLCDERRLLGVRDAARLPSNRSIISPLSLSIGYIYIDHYTHAWSHALATLKIRRALSERRY